VKTLRRRTSVGECAAYTSHQSYRRNSIFAARLSFYHSFTTCRFTQNCRLPRFACINPSFSPSLSSSKQSGLFVKVCDCNGIPLVHQWRRSRVVGPYGRHRWNGLESIEIEMNLSLAISPAFWTVRRFGLHPKLCCGSITRCLTLPPSLLYLSLRSI
jgi:hypothetical protein